MPISDSATAEQALLALARSPLTYALLHPFLDEDGNVVGSDLDLVVDCEPRYAVRIVADCLGAIGLRHVHTATESGDPLGLSFVSCDATRFVQLDLHHRPRPNTYRINYAALLASASDEEPERKVPHGQVLIYEAMKAFHKGETDRLRDRLDAIRSHIRAGEAPSLEVLTASGRGILLRLLAGHRVVGPRCFSASSRLSSRLLRRFLGPRAAPAVVAVHDWSDDSIRRVEAQLRRALSILAVANVAGAGQLPVLRPAPFGRLPFRRWLRWRRGWPLLVWDPSQTSLAQPRERQPTSGRPCVPCQSMPARLLESTVLGMSESQSGLLCRLEGDRLPAFLVHRVPGPASLRLKNRRSRR